MNQQRQNLIQKICCCPICHSSLLWEENICSCPHCEQIFPYKNGKIYFHDQKADLTSEAAFHLSLLENETLTAKMVRLARRVITSEYEPHDQLSDALRHVTDKEILVECGSGNRRLRENVINIDLQPFENVDLVTDIIHLPLADESADMVIFDTVLEHVKEPQQCINEAYRILKPGGRVICITPFVFPYHSYPKHYWNFSEDGLSYLFRHFSECDIETNMGPTSGLINLISEYVALAFSGKNQNAYLLCKGIALIPIFFLKYLDRLWYGSEKSKRIAMCLFASARK